MPSHAVDMSSMLSAQPVVVILLRVVDEAIPFRLRLCPGS